MPGRLSQTITLLALLNAGAPAAFACDLCAISGAAEAQGESGPGFFDGVAEQFTATPVDLASAPV
jgi:hypothetical protein